MAQIIKPDDVDAQLAVKEVEGSKRSAFIPSQGIVPQELLGASGVAEQILTEARQSAQQILTRAKEAKEAMAGQVEVERKKGYDQGYQEGLGQVTEMLAAAKVEREKTLKDAEPELIQMVFQIAEKILGDAVQRGAVVDVVRQALIEAGGERVTVRVNPEDLDRLRAAEPKIREELASLKSLVVLPDETVELGGCSVDTEVGTIDAQLSTQLAAIKKSLGLTE